MWFWRRNSTRVPAERRDASKVNWSSGKSRSSRICKISSPTIPVAPTRTTCPALISLLLWRCGHLTESGTNQVTHLRRTNPRTSWIHDVSSPVALIQHALDCRLNSARRLWLVQGILQHHGHRIDGGDGIGDTLPGDVRGTAVHRFKDAYHATDTGGGQHTNGAS